MTYILGWKFKQAVIICADTAATQTGDSAIPADANQPTSFGQPPFYKAAFDQKVSVSEGLMKIVKLDHALVAWAGSSLHARFAISAMARSFEQWGDDQTPPIVLGRWASQFRQDFPVSDLQLIIAVPDPGGARLFGYNVYKDDRSVQEFTATGTDGVLLQLGSVDPGQQRGMGEFLNQVSGRDAHPGHALTMILGYMQSRSVEQGIDVDTMRRGIGGAYCGGMMINDQFFWGPDILFALFEPSAQFRMDTVLSVIRHNSLIVRSTIVDLPRAFVSTINCDPHEVCERIRGEKLSGVDVDFVVFLAIGQPAITVVEMQRKGIVEGLQLVERETPTGKFHGELLLSPGLERIVAPWTAENWDGETGAITFLPYREPTDRFEQKEELFVRPFAPLLKKETVSPPEAVAESAVDAGNLRDFLESDQSIRPLIAEDCIASESPPTGGNTQTNEGQDGIAVGDRSTHSQN